MRSTGRLAMALAVALAMLVPVPVGVAGATAQIDGRVTAGDGYTLQGSAIDPDTGRNFGEIYVTRDANRVYGAVAFNALNQGDVLNENVYGDSTTYHDAFATGWSNHTFNSLLGSDHLDVRVTCNGTVVDSFGQDYLYLSGGAYKSDQFGNDGDVMTGSGPVASSS